MPADENRVAASDLERAMTAAEKALASGDAAALGWQLALDRVAQGQAKLDRLREDYDLLARWAGEQNAGNAFAEQVAMYARARLAEWDEPLERWEP